MSRREAGGGQKRRRIPVVRSRRVVRSVGDAWRARGQSVALVPTMGALHDGHRALIRLASNLTSRTVVSVFVNPTQFGPGEDYERYPRAEARDRRLAAAAGADLLYAPPVDEVYPFGFETRVEVAGLSRRLCGRRRPGHFAGVAVVVLKLLIQVRPDVLIMGQKDAQQALIVRRMLVDLDMDREVRLVVHPTVREPDGLALSSRNRYLTTTERRQAPVLYHALRAGVDRIAAGERRTGAVRRTIRSYLRRASQMRVEYVRLVDTESLLEHDRLPREVLIAVAARLGQARLIDNVVVQLSA